MDLSTIDARKALAGKYATKYGLDVVLVCALAENESSWNPWATRFEPGFLRRYVKPADANNPTTAEVTKATSFGLCQVMGQVAREMGFSGQFLTELCDPDVGLEYGCIKLARCIKSHPGSLEGALQAYNGGSDPTYFQRVLDRMSKYQGGSDGNTN